MCSEEILTLGTCYLGDWENIAQFLMIPIIFGVSGGCLIGSILIFFKKS